MLIVVLFADLLFGVVGIRLKILVRDGR